MAPFPIVDLLVAGFKFGFPRAHVNEQIQIPIQKLHCKVICFQLPARLLLLGGLWAAMAEQQEATGLRCAEVEGDGACLLSVPLGQGDEGLRGLEGDWVQGRNILAAEHQVTIQSDFGISLDGQAGELQLEIIVLVDHLEDKQKPTESI